MSPCLMMHGLGTPPATITDAERRYWLPEATFAEIVALAGEARLTIDDGNATDVSIALPALRRAGLTASFFIPSDRIGTPGYVSEDDIRALHAAGMEIGSHGCAHVCWTQVSDAQIAHDVMHSIERLSAIIGAPVRTVAVPFGDCDRRVLRVLRSLGVSRVYTSFPGPGGAWIVRRYCIKADVPLAAIRRLLTTNPSPADRAMAFLRTWRHAGTATLWSA